MIIRAQYSLECLLQRFTFTHNHENIYICTRICTNIYTVVRTSALHHCWRALDVARVGPHRPSRRISSYNKWSWRTCSIICITVHTHTHILYVCIMYIKYLQANERMSASTFVNLLDENGFFIN